MAEFLGSAWWLIVALGLLVTFHEFGHYWVARRCGVKVLKFSVGFGSALWSRKAADGTEYVLAAIPLGGYVKMLDEREAEVSPDELDSAFNRKPVAQRFAIVAAGPLFNLVFAVLAFWLMFMLGTLEPRPVIGAPAALAASAGFAEQDEILAIDGQETTTWSHVLLVLIEHALDRDSVSVEVENPQGIRRELTLDLSGLDDSFKEEAALESIGLKPWRPVVPAEIGAVSPGSAAEAAGMRSGDLLKSIAGEPVDSWSQVPGLVQQHGVDGAPMQIELEREGQHITIEASARAEKSGWFSQRWVLGIGARELNPETRAAVDRTWRILRHGPIDALGAAVSETWLLTGSTLGLLKRMLTGSASVRNISGPIGIAQFANASASAGLSSFLFFLGLISLSLGILNLLPIPILDGGHLLFYLIEFVKGSPLSDELQVAGQKIGMVLLFGLISLGIFNDIWRLVG